MTPTEHGIPFPDLNTAQNLQKTLTAQVFLIKL